jgi:hypothetical protein
MTENIIVTVRSGIAEVHGSPQADVTVLDFDKDTEFDYDTAHSYVSTILASDLSGPEQFQLIEEVTERFLGQFGGGRHRGRRPRLRRGPHRRDGLLERPR